MKAWRTKRIQPNTDGMRELSPDEQRFMHAAIWHESRIGSAVKHARNWRLMALTQVPIIVLLILLYTHRASQSTIVPHLVYLDSAGHVLWHGPPGSWELSNIQIGTSLQEWIKWVRARPDDLTIVGDNWQMAWNMMAGDAAQAPLKEYMAREDPRKQTGPKIRVTVQITNVLKLPGEHNYQITWEEEWKDTYGKVIQRPKWTAFLPVLIKPGKTVGEIKANPRGIYVKSGWSWAQELTATGGR